MVSSTPPANEPVAPAQLAWMSALAVVHADRRPVGPGTRLGDGDGDVAQLERTMANARVLILRIAES